MGPHSAPGSLGPAVGGPSAPPNLTCCLCCPPPQPPSPTSALDLLPAELYPVLFQAAFLDGRTLALRDLVGTWPFPVLSFQRLLGHRGRHSLLEEKPSKLCVQAIILAVVAHLRRESGTVTLTPRCRLRVLDMTGLQDGDTDRGPEGMSLWSGTVALAKACIEVSKHQSPSGTSAALQPVGVEVRADLFVNGTSYGVLRDALQTGATSRVSSWWSRSLFMPGGGNSWVPARGWGAWDLGGFAAIPYHGPSGNTGTIPTLSFKDLNPVAAPAWFAPHAVTALGARGSLFPLPGSDLQAPLESLELAFCYLLPGDLAFLSQSLHAPALRKLDLSGHDFSENLLQPLRHLLEETSASLLHLDLMECRLTDARLEALLPALCRCSRLRCLGLFGNPLSTPGLKTLLRKTLVLPDLRLVVYPYPVDCYIWEPPRPPSASDHFFEDVVDEERFTPFWRAGKGRSSRLGRNCRAGKGKRELLIAGAA
uniref:Leucine rich repeat containing 14 n=1 Tax=Buteo japonicus TaxID=224669 RepID=A0A8B9Z8Y5_9AVES